jgi:hypothetical protein
MTEVRLPLNELLQKAGDGDFLRAVAESVLQLLMEADVEGLIGAAGTNGPPICESAWNKDPVFGVIGIQSGPRG